MTVKQCAEFLAEFVRRPGVVGAVAPSSPVLARRMVEWIDWPKVQTVVEYGPGTGAFTGRILAEKPPAATFFALEINPRFVAALADRYPEVNVYQESVGNVQAVCGKEGVAHVDAILCGLPWAAFSDEDQTAYLDAMMAVLRPGGQFVTFAYLQGLLLPAGQRFRRKLRRYFATVEMSRTAWRNFPPAFVYRCRR
ncbi:MAG: methyltransferase domain-containing protein [Thermoguttaceae bacterium]